MASSVPPSTTPASEPSREIRRVALSSYIGTTVELYDFLLYGTAAAVVFNRLFFPELDPIAGLLASFGTLAAGYFARPLGGLVFGHFGDRLGRKRMLLLTMLMMGIASTLIGLLPTYAQIGIAAPALLVLLRIIQGLAVGGEWGGAALMTVEHASAGSRGKWGGVTQMGGPTGALLATLALALVGLLPDDQFLSWGWRLPFLVSVVLIAVGLFVRLRISESPVFARAVAEDAKARVPSIDVLRTHPKNLVLAIVAGLAPFAAQGIFTGFIISYAMENGYERTQALTAVVISSALAIALTPVFAILSDRIGRRPVYLTGALGLAVVVFPAFWLVDSGSPIALVLGVVLPHAIIVTSMYSTMAALLAEMFATRLRYTGASLSYQGATVLGAGLSPLLATSILASGAGSTGISAVLALAGVISAIAIWVTGETRRRDLNSAASEPVA